MRKAWSRGSVLLGQVPPHLMITAARKCKLELDVRGYDPGEGLRPERLHRRGAWDAERIERRIRRSNEGYKEIKEIEGAHMIDGQAELVIYIRNYAAARATEMDLKTPSMTKQPARFVFDYSGPLSRRLEIDQ